MRTLALVAASTGSNWEMSFTGVLDAVRRSADAGLGGVGLGWRRAPKPTWIPATCLHASTRYSPSAFLLLLAALMPSRATLLRLREPRRTATSSPTCAAT